MPSILGLRRPIYLVYISHAILPRSLAHLFPLPLPLRFRCIVALRLDVQRMLRTASVLGAVERRISVRQDILRDGILPLVDPNAANAGRNPAGRTVKINWPL